MKTAREKAEHWLAMNVAEYTKKQLDCLEVFAKEISRDTRHACAVEVLGCRAMSMSGNLVNLDEAYAAIMNTKAV